MAGIAIVVGARIKELRSKKKWTQEQLAEYADLHVSYIIALEKGRKNTSIEALYRISNALEISPADFFTIPQAAISPVRTLEERQREERIEALVREFSQKLIREIDLKNAADESAQK